MIFVAIHRAKAKHKKNTTKQNNRHTHTTTTTNEAREKPIPISWQLIQTDVCIHLAKSKSLCCCAMFFFLLLRSPSSFAWEFAFFIRFVHIRIFNAVIRKRTHEITIAKYAKNGIFSLSNHFYCQHTQSAHFYLAENVCFFACCRLVLLLYQSDVVVVFCFLVLITKTIDKIAASKKSSQHFVIVSDGKTVCVPPRFAYKSWIFVSDCTSTSVFN